MQIESIGRTTAIPQKGNLPQERVYIARAGWAGWVGLIVLVIYLALLPFVERTWRTTGDEPHYLLTAHSLVTDGDFDLTNNYAQLDYLDFYFSKDIAPQVRTNMAGQQILDHQLGLPLLIAPAYALGGRFGVLLFQAILAGLLAALTFKLAVEVSGDEIAALLATLFVALSPPLLLYPFLVYPELLGALLTTVVVYYALTKNEATRTETILVILSLLALPWLNRRFVPLALLLALLISWAWRQRGGFSNVGLWALGGVVLSMVGLTWLNYQFEAPARLDITAPTSGSLLGLRLARGIGWLLDQQRGLLIFAPIYSMALWGVLPLLHKSWQQRNRQWFALLPFLLSLGLAAGAGGFWVAWELGPRFLVVALPTLAPLLALAWQHYCRSRVWTGLTLFLFGWSVANGLIILQNPELPYKSSLPLYYSEKWNLPLTEWLPDLAGYEIITAIETNPETTNLKNEQGQMVWFAEIGRTTNLIQPTVLPELPFGHYHLTWPVRVGPNLPAETDLIRLTVQFLGGGQLFNQVFNAADLPVAGQYGLLQYNFLNTNVDRWRTPLVLTAVSSGQSQIWAKDLSLSPQPFYAWVLPYLYLGLLGVGAGLCFAAWPDIRLSSQKRTLPTFSQPILWTLSLILGGVVLGYLIYQRNQGHYTYDANDLSHFVGQPLDDPEAEDGLAWLVDPAVDPPQKAIYGPFDIYEPGTYRVTFRMKLVEPVETDQDLARLQVNATANFDELVTQPIRREHFAELNAYHHFVLIVTNPRRQALSFEVYYTGVAPVVIDGVMVERDGDS